VITSYLRTASRKSSIHTVIIIIVKPNSQANQVNATPPSKQRQRARANRNTEKANRNPFTLDKQAADTRTGNKKAKQIIK
jgi:hypothetical protein